MAWIIFDEADHQTPAPHFCLPTQNGNKVCLRDYQEDCNLVLLIFRGSDCEECWKSIESFDARLDEYRAQDAKVLAVIPRDGRLVREHMPQLKVSFPLLLDPEEKVRRAYAGLMDASLVADEDLLIFVLDRYNAPYAAWIGKELSDPTIHQDVQSWLAFIGVQCPE